jgi:hypothetical protein
MQPTQTASLLMTNIRQKLTSYALKVIITALEELYHINTLELSIDWD